jgi:hypothetical protein
LCSPTRRRLQNQFARERLITIRQQLANIVRVARSREQPDRQVPGGPALRGRPERRCDAGAERGAGRASGRGDAAVAAGGTVRARHQRHPHGEHEQQLRERADERVRAAPVQLEHQRRRRHGRDRGRRDEQAHAVATRRRPVMPVRRLRLVREPGDEGLKLAWGSYFWD